MTLDLGGSNLRVCWVTLDGNRGVKSVEQHKYPCGQNDELKNGNADMLWTWVTDCLHAFMEENKLVGTAEKPIPLSFCFSYPATQHYIDHGILQRWTKGFNISGVEGQDAAAQLVDAMKRKVRVGQDYFMLALTMAGSTHPPCLTDQRHHRSHDCNCIQRL